MGTARTLSLSSCSVQAALCIAFSFLLAVVIGCTTNSHASPGALASSIIGWSYFSVWTISFFPQVILNQQRKSVSGLSRDMVVLAAFGFVCYMTYNIALFAPNSAAAREYAVRYGAASAVTLPDLSFSAFGVAMNLIVLAQMAAFDPQWWRLSWIWAGILASLVTAACGGAVAAGVGGISWLSYVTALSWVKLAATLIKYTPQVILNARRRATRGFHVLGVSLDLAGSVLSLVQLGLDCYLAGSFSLVVGDPAKFGLGLLTMLFDCMLIGQHWCYNNAGVENADESTPQSTAEELLLLRSSGEG